MAAGIPEIKPVKHLTGPILNTTQEAREWAYIENQFCAGTSFSIVLESGKNGFNTRQFWYDLYQFETRILSIPGVQGVESLTPVVFRTALKFAAAGIRPEAVFHQMRLKTDENDLLRTYFDPDRKKLRLIVHIQSRSSDGIEAILVQAEREAVIFSGQDVRVSLSGQLILLRSQITDLVSSQLKTLVLAVFVITGLMMIQLRSVKLGALSLIPNLFPLVTIFGTMGWFKIPLDPLTLFAAVISFGLSVDDSIHYLTALQREIVGSGPGCHVARCLQQAYDKTSRAIVSTTAVLFLSALGLVFSSFSHVVSLGVLIASASLVALIGDLVFMPAAVLTFKPLNRMVSGKIFTHDCPQPKKMK
jgi:hypothetical protein